MLKEPAKAVDYIVNWIKEYLEKSRAKGLVVGVSGGIDSALTSTLAALTRYPTIVLNMPILQSAPEYQRSCEHIEWLKSKFSNVSSYEVDMSSVLSEYMKVLPKEIQTAHNMANLRSRLRMVCLYAFAGHFGYLVVGTGNKIEDFGIGFFTKYGDGGVDISPIADLMKSEVYQLAKHLGIVESIIKAKPTDGLFEGSPTDEEKIGATYDELEWAMKYFEKPTTQPLTERQKEVLNIYQTRHQANLHKMQPIPVCKLPEDWKV
ncbi:MAG: NH(3)-dependent NAD(+) synthetase [Bacteroidia bacterium]|nr:MAG: NH(3)-dependent NAD(+) synthetase [Bacteroidia bacterium]